VGGPLGAPGARKDAQIELRLAELVLLAGGTFGEMLLERASLKKPRILDSSTLDLAATTSG
jgi:hypothetical protein